MVLNVVDESLARYERSIINGDLVRYERSVVNGDLVRYGRQNQLIIEIYICKANK